MIFSGYDIIATCVAKEWNTTPLEPLQLYNEIYYQAQQNGFELKDDEYAIVVWKVFNKIIFKGFHDKNKIARHNQKCKKIQKVVIK